MSFLRTLRFSLLLGTALTPFPCFLLSGSKYFDFGTVIGLWILMVILAMAMKLVTRAIEGGKRLVSRSNVKDTPVDTKPPTFPEEVMQLAFVGDYFVLAIGLLPSVILYFFLLLFEFPYATNGYLLSGSLVSSVLWLRWLEKRQLAVIRLPLIPVKLIYVVAAAAVLGLLGALKESLF